MITLHIGTDKTGSTAIQKMLFWNQEFLKKKGYLYPRVGMMHYDHANLSIALKNKEFHIFEDLKKEINSYNIKHIIFSHEGFYHLNKEILLKFYYFLKSLNKGDIKIILYLRRQDEMIESGMLQQMKTNEKMFDLDALKEIFYLEHLNYFNLVKKFDEIFGKENVILRPYGKKFLPYKDSLLKDFYNYAFYEKNFKFEDLVISEKDQNPSIDAVSAYVISFLHKIGLTNLYFDDIVDQLLWIQNYYGKSKKRLFNKQQRINLLSKYESTNIKLKGRVPIELFEIDKSEQFETVTNEEVSKRLSDLYLRKNLIVGCRTWYGGEGKLVHKVNENKIILIEGWYPLENWGCWAKGDENSRLVFRIARTKVYCDKIKIKIKAKYLKDSNSVSYVKVENNSKTYEVKVTENTIIEVNTNEIIKNGHLVFLKFRHENAKSPKELGINEDRRILGVGIEDISFEEIVQ